MPTYPSDFYSSSAATTTTTSSSFVLQDARNPPPPPPPPPSSKTSTTTTTTTTTTTSAKSATSRKDKTSSTADLNLKVDGIYPHSSRPRPTATATAMSPHPHHLHSDSGFLATDTDTDPVLLDTPALSPPGKDIDLNPSSSFWYSPTTSPTSPTLPHSVSASNSRPDSDGHLADSQHTDRTSQMMGVEERLGQGLRREESDSDMAYRRRKANRELSFNPNTFLDALKEKNERQRAGAGNGLEDANGVHTANIDTPTAQIVNGFRHLYTPADSHSYLETEKKEEDDHAATPTYTPYQTPPEVYNKDGDGDASRDRDNLDVDHDFDTPFHTPLEEHHHHRNHFSNSNSDPSASASASATASAIDQSTSSTSTSFQPPSHQQMPQQQQYPQISVHPSSSTSSRPRTTSSPHPPSSFDTRHLYMAQPPAPPASSTTTTTTTSSHDYDSNISHSQPQSQSPYHQAQQLQTQTSQPQLRQQQQPQFSFSPPSSIPQHLPPPASSSQESQAAQPRATLPSSLQIPYAMDTSTYRPPPQARRSTISSQHPEASHDNLSQGHNPSPAAADLPPRRSSSAPRRASLSRPSVSGKRTSRSGSQRRRDTFTLNPNDRPQEEAENQDPLHATASRTVGIGRQETLRTQQRRLSRSRRRRREEDDDDKVMVGTKVDQNHQNFVTAYNMLTGIRFTVSRTNAKIDRPLRDEDFDASFKFSFDVTGRELTPSAKYDFKFKDYAPWVFRHLRARFKLDPADYLMSLTSKYILSELGSPGKSGSFFYFSRDYKYIIKTIHHSEHKLLRRVLRDYYEHVDANPNTLISQFYGLHRVKMAYGRKIHFVVMNNLFPPHRDIHQMFDLKGSTVGRDYREEDLARNPRATMKDLNWLRREKHLHCGPLRKDVFMAQLRRDVALLQRLNIMDYSLLVGMHDTRKGNDAKLRDRALQVYQPESNSGQFKGVGGEADAAAAAAAAEGSTQAQRPRESSDADVYEDGAELTAQGDRGSGVMSRSRRVRDSLVGNTPVPLEQMREKSTEDILNQVHQLVFYSEEGGYRATNEEGEPIGEIYYLGIIDCLTTYGVVKKAENFWKGLSHNRNEISPIPPVGYAARFIEFIDQITKSPEQHAREREEREREKERQRALGLRPSISSDQAASGTTTPTQGNFLSHHGTHGTNNNNNGNSHPNGRGKHGDSGGGPHHSHIFGTFNDNQGSHNSSAAVLPVVEEVPGESRNGSIRSQHASSMQIYENLMKGTSSRYEVRLSAAGGAGAGPARSPGSPPTSLTRASSDRAGPANGLEMIGGGSIRRSFTVPDGGQITNLDGHMSDSGLTGIVEVSNFSGFDGGDAEDEGDGDGGRSRSADSGASDASYGAVVDAYGAGGYSTNSGYGQQPHFAPRSDSNTPTADSSGPDDGYGTDHRFDRLHPDAGAYFPRGDDVDEYRTPPASQTMHVPHMPPPPDVMTLPPPPPPQRTPPAPPSPPSSYEALGKETHAEGSGVGYGNDSVVPSSPPHLDVYDYDYDDYGFKRRGDEAGDTDTTADIDVDEGHPGNGKRTNEQLSWHIKRYGDDNGLLTNVPLRSSMMEKDELFLDTFPRPPPSPTMSRS